MYSEKERQEIKDLYQKLESIRETAKEAGVSKNTVFNIIHNIKSKSKRRVGRPNAISKTCKTNIKRFVISEIGQGRVINSRIIKENFKLSASRTTIRRELHSMGFYYDFVEKVLPLKNKNCKARVEFAEKHIRERTDFQYVIFSDEKRFNLDGPDNMGSYFYENDKTTVGPDRIKRQQGGGGVMILGAISSNGNLFIKVIEGRYNTEAYHYDLQNDFIPWCRSEFLGKEWIWQQDNCRIHTTALIKKLFVDQKVDVLEWPSYSPDINIIENVWNMMNTLIYQNKQYRTKKQLTDAIIEAASKIDKEAIKNLFVKFPNRLINLIKNKGKKMDY